MKPFIILFTASCVFSICAGAQEISNYSFVTRLIGTGEINTTLKVSAVIDLIPRVDYTSDGCVSKHYNQIVGSYRYATQNGSISLIGEQITWTQEKGEVDSLVIFELNDKFERTAQFIGRLKEKHFTGIWKSLKTLKSFPFSITFKSDNYGSLIVPWKNKSFNLIDLNDGYNQSTYKTIKQIDKGDSLIVVLETTSPCCGLYNCRGANCGGADTYVYLYTLTSNSVSYFKERIESSCDAEEIKERTTNNNQYLVVTEDVNGQQFSVTIDYTGIAKGVVKRKK